MEPITVWKDAYKPGGILNLSKVLTLNGVFLQDWSTKKAQTGAIVLNADKNVFFI